MQLGKFLDEVVLFVTDAQESYLLALLFGLKLVLRATWSTQSILVIVDHDHLIRLRLVVPSAPLLRQIGAIVARQHLIVSFALVLNRLQGLLDVVVAHYRRIFADPGHFYG